MYTFHGLKIEVEGEDTEYMIIDSLNDIVFKTNNFDCFKYVYKELTGRDYEGEL